MASSSSAAAFLADEASPEQERLQTAVHDYLQRLDVNRPAGARGNKQTPTWLVDALTQIQEPPADADEGDRFLGIIPVAQWRGLREEFPNMAWIMLVEIWYRQFGVSTRVPKRTISDTTLAGWSTRMKEFIEDVSVVAWGPRKQDPLLATQQYDICHRLGLLYQGTGSFPIFPKTVELLAEFYTPAFERISPPDVETESFAIVGDSALALCVAGNQKNTIKSKHLCIDRLREELLFWDPLSRSTLRASGWRFHVRFGHCSGLSAGHLAGNPKRVRKYHRSLVEEKLVLPLLYQLIGCDPSHDRFEESHVGSQICWVEFRVVNIDLLGLGVQRKRVDDPYAMLPQAVRDHSHLAVHHRRKSTSKTRLDYFLTNILYPIS